MSLARKYVYLANRNNRSPDSSRARLLNVSDALPNEKAGIGCSCVLGVYLPCTWAGGRFGGMGAD